MSWSPQQQAMLEAMGYTLWRSAGASMAGAAVASIAVTEDGARSAPTARAADASLAGTGDDPLLRALRRAAGGRDPSPLLPPLDGLRGDAKAKRALWPRLRALRRS